MYQKVPMGLKIAGSQFIQYMKKALDLIPNWREFVFVIMDDICIFSRTEEEHIEHIRLVLELMAKKNPRKHRSHYPNSDTWDSSFHSTKMDHQC